MRSWKLPSFPGVPERLTQAINAILREIALDFAKARGVEGQSLSTTSDLDLGGKRIRNAGSGASADTDVPAIKDAKQDGLWYDSGQGGHVASRPILARAGVRIPPATRPDEAPQYQQVQALEGLRRATASPPEVESSGAVGSVTDRYALQDHTHAGCNLTDTQTVGGAKTFSGDLRHTGTNLGFHGAAVSPQGAASANLVDNSGGAADGTIALITNAANPGSADVGPTQNAIADLAAKLNGILGVLRTKGLIAP